MSRFFKFLTSGFGTNTMAGQAVGWVIAICLGLIWIAYKIIKLIVDIVKANKMIVPDFKNGIYNVQLTNAGSNPHKLKKELKRIKGYTSFLANKVVGSAPCIIVRGVEKEDGEDFKTVFEATGATIDIVTAS